MGLTFGGNDFSDYNVIVDSVKSWEKPVRDRTLVHVPGRNGDLILDNGCWQNLNITYHCLIKDDWKTSFPAFCKMIYNLRGYQRLFDDNHPDVYRMAEFAGGISPDMIFTTDEGTFDITFNCKPQMYVTGIPQLELDFTSADATESFDNEYGMTAFPRIRVNNAGSGAVLYVFGGGEEEWTLTIAPNSYDGIVIDCDSETIYAVDEFGDFIAYANNLVTITPGADTDTGERDFPYILPTTGLYIKAFHSYYGNTYTGSTVVDLRVTRI